MWKQILAPTVIILLVLACGVSCSSSHDLWKGKSAPDTGADTRRVVSPWFIMEDEAESIAQLREQADILSSISIFGEASPAFMEECRRHNIDVFYAVSGGAGEFDTPARARATVEGYLKLCRENGYDGIDLDLEHLDPSLQDKYSAFLRLASRELHRAGKKMAMCVGYYPAMYRHRLDDVFYDCKVVGETCDMVRVMCYDLYWAPGKGREDLADREDVQGIGPTSTAPWAKEAMAFWLQYVPREKLIMGLPAYSNDYDMTPGGGGAQVTAPKPSVRGDGAMDRSWLPYEQLHVYRYLDGQGHPHSFFASDARSTGAHLATVDDLDLPGISFWYYQAVTPDTWQTIREWLKNE